MASQHPNEPEQLPTVEASVFLNCPFDDEYKPLLNAMMLAVLSCGFVPRIADEGRLPPSLPRMERICQALHGSRFSIHDLCRCRGEGEDNFGRFNMPLELGIAMGWRYATIDDPDQEHDWLVLTPGDHTHQKFISDLAGFDPKMHDETPETLVPAIMTWLLADPRSPGYDSGITPDRVIDAIPKLDADLAKLNARWAGSLPWDSRVTAARSVVATLLPPDQHRRS